LLTIWLTADDPLGLVGSNPTPGAKWLTPDGLSTLGEIVTFGLWMEKEGYRKSTTQFCVQALKSVARKANLLDTESVKSYLAHAPFSESRKSKLTEDLARFYRWKNIPFEKPNYRRIERLPFVPTEVEVDQLISGVGKKTATFLQLIKETGVRPGEAWNIKWTDIDFERDTVNITPEKNSNPRQLRISSQFIGMLNQLPRKHEYMFRNPKIDPMNSMDVFSKSMVEQRGRVAERFQNMRINSISFRSLRHFKATMEYHRTKDILHVMNILGHKNIKNTLVYTHLVNWENDEFVCKIATTIEEAKQLIESGFEYVTEVDGQKLFRKRK
jgi:integrase